MPELSAEQFQLFDPGPRAAGPFRSELQEKKHTPGPQHSYGRDGAHDMGSWGSESYGEHYTDNPLPRTQDDYYDHLNRMYAEGKSRPTTTNEFIPTYKIRTQQPEVNMKAVEHHVQNANPLKLDEDPYVMEYPSYEGETLYDLGDGNHRVNAALRRGQLFTPANVERYQ